MNATLLLYGNSVLSVDSFATYITDLMMVSRAVETLRNQEIQ